MIYKLYSTDIYDPTKIDAATTVGVNPQISFLFAPENPDYQAFKTNVLAGAELQDADGNVMTQAEADAFIATLP